MKDGKMKSSLTSGKGYSSSAELLGRSFGNFTYDLPCAYAANINAYLTDAETLTNLHIDSSKSQAWTACASNYYNLDNNTAVQDWLDLLTSGSGYRVLQYSGNKDLTVPTIGTERWIDSLKLDIDKAWCQYRFIHTPENLPKVGGFYQSYKAGLTFATIHGAGAFHTLD